MNYIAPSPNSIQRVHFVCRIKRPSDPEGDSRKTRSLATVQRSQYTSRPTGKSALFRSAHGLQTSMSQKCHSQLTSLSQTQTSIARQLNRQLGRQSMKSPLKGLTLNKLNSQSARFNRSCSGEGRSDGPVGSRSPGTVMGAGAREPKQAIFAPSRYGYNSLLTGDGRDPHLVCVARPEGQMTFREHAKAVGSSQDVSNFVLKHPET
jgi:hypothetical protein